MIITNSDIVFGLILLGFIIFVVLPVIGSSQDDYLTSMKLGAVIVGVVVGTFGMIVSVLGAFLYFTGDLNESIVMYINQIRY